MSRSGYSDDIDNWALIKWRGAVTSASKGSRGQAFFREALRVLDAMPVKELAAQTFVEGGFCLLGAVGSARGLDMAQIDPEEPDRDMLAELFNIAPALAAEVMYENDECIHDRWERVEVEGPPTKFYGRHLPTKIVEDVTTDARRWVYMRQWVASQIAPADQAQHKEQTP